jgi:hypothetical protein
MPERDPFKDLAGARKRGDPWYLIALKAREAINQRGSGLKGEALLIAARAAGYSANLLDRYIAVANFIDELAKEKIAPSRKLRNAPFASMEHLKRAWRIDSSEGRRLLTAVLSGSISVRTLGTRVGEMERQAGTAAGQRLADLQTRAAQAEAMLNEMMSICSSFVTIRARSGCGSKAGSQISPGQTRLPSEGPQTECPTWTGLNLRRFLRARRRPRGST